MNKTYQNGCEVEDLVHRLGDDARSPDRIRWAGRGLMRKTGRNFLAQEKIDVLIELAPAANRCLSYFGLARMQFELEAIFGRPVDLSLADSLDPYIRSEVLSTAEILYDAA